MRKGHPEFDPDQARGADGRWTGGDAPSPRHGMSEAEWKDHERLSAEAKARAEQHWAVLGTRVVSSPPKYTKPKRLREVTAAEKTAAVNWAKGQRQDQSSAQVNRALRKAKGDTNKLTPEIARAVKLLDAFTASWETSKDVVLYRGLGGVFAQRILNEKVVPGDKLSNYGYTSTSNSSEIASSFARGDAGLLMEVIVPKGQKLGMWADESELVLPRGLTLEYLGPKPGLTMVLGAYTWRPYTFQFRVVSSVGKGYPEFDPDQPRNEDGTWVGGGSGKLATPRPATPSAFKRLGRPSMDVRRAVRSYVEDMSTAVRINSGLRVGDKSDEVDDLDTFTSSFVVDKDSAVYRAVADDDIDEAAGELSAVFANLKVGDVITNAGYSSTTPDASAISFFGPIKMEVILPKGARVGVVSRTVYGLYSGGRDEVLLPRNAKLRYNGKRGDYYQFTLLSSVTKGRPKSIKVVKDGKAVKGNPEFNPDQARGPDGKWTGGGSRIAGPDGRLSYDEDDFDDNPINDSGAYESSDLNRLTSGKTFATAVQRYTSEAGSDFNTSLRVEGIDGKNVVPYMGLIAELDAFTRTAVTTKEGSVWRGIDPDVALSFDGAAPGFTYTDPAFVSASLRSTVPEEQITGGFLMMEIILPKGAHLGPALDHSKFADEEEIILPRDANFKYDGWYMAGKKTIYRVRLVPKA